MTTFYDDLENAVEQGEGLVWRSPLLSATVDEEGFEIEQDWLRIQQPRDDEFSRNKGKLIVGGVAMDSVVLTPIARAQYRGKQQEGSGQDGSPITYDCLSEDMVTGVGDPGGACKECPFADWRDGSKLCQPAVEYKFLTEDEEEVLYTFRRKGYDRNGGKALNRMVRDHGMGKFQIELKTLKDFSSDGKFEYYRPFVAVHNADR